jgi:hypothetical protein
MYFLARSRETSHSGDDGHKFSEWYKQNRNSFSNWVNNNANSLGDNISDFADWITGNSNPAPLPTAVYAVNTPTQLGMFDTRTNSLQTGYGNSVDNHSFVKLNNDDGYGKTFYERAGNIDLWKKIGSDILFGKDDPKLQIATFEDNPATYLMGGAGVKFVKSASKSSKVWEVYRLINTETKSIEYIGKTSRGFMTRFSEHLVDPLKQDWINSVQPFLYRGNLTKYGAKYYEQSLILKYKLQNLRNVINGVAEKYWTNYGLRK